MLLRFIKQLCYVMLSYLILFNILQQFRQSWDVAAEHINIPFVILFLILANWSHHTLITINVNMERAKFNDTFSTKKNLWTKKTQTFFSYFTTPVYGFIPLFVHQWEKIFNIRIKDETHCVWALRKDVVRLNAKCRLWNINPSVTFSHWWILINTQVDESVGSPRPTLSADRLLFGCNCEVKWDIWSWACARCCSVALCDT